MECMFFRRETRSETGLFDPFLQGYQNRIVFRADPYHARPMTRGKGSGAGIHERKPGSRTGYGLQSSGGTIQKIIVCCSEEFQRDMKLIG
jgi:hypothetical protein